MTVADLYERKADVLLRQATLAVNASQRRRIIEEAKVWRRLADDARARAAADIHDIGGAADEIEDPQ